MKHTSIFFLVAALFFSFSATLPAQDDPWPIGVIARFDDHGTGIPFDTAVKMGAPTMQLKVPTKKNRTPENAEIILKKLKENRVELSCVLSGFAGESYASIPIVKETVGLVPKATRKERVEEFKEVSDFAAALKCGVVQFHLGFVPHDTDSADYRDIVQVVQGACDYIKKHGQRLQLETGQETGAALLRFIQDVDRPNLAVNFDPANMILYGCGDPIEALKLVGKFVKSTHVKDAKWAEKPGEEWGREVLFGTGDVGAERFLQTLKEVGFQGTLTIERENRESPEHQRNDVLKTIELLKELKKKILPSQGMTLTIYVDGQKREFPIDPPEITAVKAEQYDRLAVFNEKGAEYNRATKLKQTQAQECPTAYAVDPKSIVVREKEGGIIYEAEKDYRVEEKWGCVGRLPEGRIGENQPVFIDYSFCKMRIDSVVRTKDGKTVLKKGVSHVTIPAPPALAEGETRLVNVWIKAWTSELTDENVFPILEQKYPEAARSKPTVAERLIPKTMAKLNAGQTVNILAWGDSVTDAGYLPNPSTERWQEQFATRFRAKYPKAEIVLTTEAWGGRNSNTYRNEPPGSPKNYKEKVLDRKPDLIVMEFVNDAGMHGEYLDKRYGEILADFKANGIEWIILTPHYVRGDWMGLASEKNIDDDPRPYVKSVREFCAKNNIALADGSKRYGRLWRQGIPYSTLMMNNINHPDPFGMSLFADALMELFP